MNHKDISDDTADENAPELTNHQILALIKTQQKFRAAVQEQFSVDPSVIGLPQMYDILHQDKTGAILSIDAFNPQGKAIFGKDHKYNKPWIENTQNSALVFLLLSEEKQYHRYIPNSHGSPSLLTRHSLEKNDNYTRIRPTSISQKIANKEIGYTNTKTDQSIEDFIQKLALQDTKKTILFLQNGLLDFIPTEALVKRPVMDYMTKSPLAGFAITRLPEESLRESDYRTAFKHNPSFTTQLMDQSLLDERIDQYPKLFRELRHGEFGVALQSASQRLEKRLFETSKQTPSSGSDHPSLELNQ